MNQPLRDLLQATSKAQLQGFYVHWFPGKEVLGDRERLAVEIEEAMTDHVRVRQRFDALPRSQQGFIMALLVRPEHGGTVDEVRSGTHGRSIETFEIENVLKGLQEAGYISRVSGTGGYAHEVFGLPRELAEALRRTIAVEERQPLEMLSGGRRSVGASPGGLAERAAQRIDRLEDTDLRRLAHAALGEHGGILTRSSAAHEPLLPPVGNGFRFHRPDWRRALEEMDLGTTGILRLKDYGIELEEEGIFLYQEVVREARLEQALAGSGGHDREVSLGADLIVDIDRSLEALRAEPLEITREGNVYKKVEERIAGLFVTAPYHELHEGSPVQHIVEIGRRLQLFDEEEQKLVVDPLRRRAWRKRPLMEKVDQVFKVFLAERRGARWSFHQTAIRQLFLEDLARAPRGHWLVARPFLDAVIAGYLLRLDEAKVRDDFHERCSGDFRNETLVVAFSKLHHDLSYWLLHRLALLGLVDVAYVDGSFHAFRLANLGRRYFDGRSGEAAGSREGADEAAPSRVGSVSAGEAEAEARPPVFVNPDFEILMYPGAPEELSWKASLFADRVGSDHVKRYRLGRESVTRGIVAGLTGQEIVSFLEENAHGSPPPNVLYTVRQWTEDVEVVRQQKVLLLRAHSSGGADRLSRILDGRDVPHERLNETTVMVRGGKNERMVKDLLEHFRDHGLHVE
jgi:hypothetical protein